MPHDNPLDAAEQLIADGRPDEAARLLHTLIETGRGGLLARLLYARALLVAGETQQAIAAARETALTNPGVAAAALALGEAMLRAEQLPTAIGEFQRALRLDPALHEARFLLGCAWLQAGEPEKALDAWIELEDGYAGLADKRAEAEAMRNEPRSNANYVRHLFDQFSAEYDARMLGQLAYAAPRILRELAQLVVGLRAPKSLRVLDLGCGTGLSGEAFRDLAATLEGVDLSPAMIEKARVRNIYDALRVEDIEATLARDGEYDLILAADTLVYLGDLVATLALAARRLARNGFFLFTVEAKEGGGFELGPRRRWRHSESYLHAEAARAGFDVAGIVECVPRTEAGRPVAGLAVALTVPPNS